MRLSIFISSQSYQRSKGKCGGAAVRDGAVYFMAKELTDDDQFGQSKTNVLWSAPALLHVALK
jgi:hypothetical protein